MRLFLRLLRYLLVLVLVGVVFGCAALAFAYWLIAPRLPAVETLKDVRLQVPLRVYSAENKLIAQPLFFGQGTASIVDRVECTAAVVVPWVR